MLVSAMTLCIAAKSAALNQIIAVSDMKVSSRASSMDEALLKARTLTDDYRWVCLFSCDDLPPVEALHRRIRELLNGCNLPVSRALLETTVRTAYDNEVQHLVETRVLKPHFIKDLQAFETELRTKPDDKILNACRRKMAKITAGVELLVVGFDEHNMARMFRTSKSGEVFSDEALRFAAIGSGAQVAIDYMFRNDRFLDSFEVGELVYRLCETKFMSEMDNYVGKGTQVMVLSLSPVVPGGGVTTFVSDNAVKSARALWERRRKAKIPERLAVSLGDNGETFCQGGKSLFHFADRAFTDASVEYIDLTDRLMELRERDAISDEEWRNTESIKESFREAHKENETIIKEWKYNRDVKPHNVEWSIQRLIRINETLRYLVSKYSKQSPS